MTNTPTNASTNTVIIDTNSLLQIAKAAKPSIYSSPDLLPAFNTAARALALPTQDDRRFLFNTQSSSNDQDLALFAFIDMGHFVNGLSEQDLNIIDEHTRQWLLAQSWY